MGNIEITNQCSDGEYRNYINIIDDEITDDDPQLQTVIEENMTEAHISNESTKCTRIVDCLSVNQHSQFRIN